MSNRIRQIKVRNGQLIPAQSEVWITVVPEYQTATTELRGRLMGPRCPYSSTVEVAYPLRTPPPHLLPGTPGITRQVIIPEASLWEPQCPFLYRGPIELWQDGQRCDRVLLSHGMRALRLSERGLLVNFRPLTLHGRIVAACSEEEALRWHQAGYSLLLAPVQEETLPLWEQADRFGFLMLGQVNDGSEETLRYLTMLSRHTSCLGWLIDAAGSHPPLDLLPNRLVGLTASTTLSCQRLLGWVDFLFGPTDLANLGKPLLVKGDAPLSSSEGCLILGNVV